MKLSTREGMAISIGIELALSVVFGLGVGYWLDKKLGTSPWCTLVGTVVGTAAGFRSLYMLMQRNAREEAREEARAKAAAEKLAGESAAGASTNDAAAPTEPTETGSPRAADGRRDDDGGDRRGGGPDGQA